MAFLARFLKSLPLLIVSPLVMLITAVALAVADIFSPSSSLPEGGAATQAKACSIVIPNWNGRDLLARYLPFVEAAVAGNPANEILVVDNGSTDGSVQFLSENFPRVKALALERNLGFGGGSNAGFQAAANDIVVLLNNDMRVEPDFLAPLVAGFTDDKVFAVSCQIFFSDSARLREATGLTQVWW